MSELRTSFLGQAGNGDAVASTSSRSFRRGAVPLYLEIEPPEHGNRQRGSGCGPIMRHPICKVFGWQERLKKEPGLTKAQIAKDERLSKARMTQMFSLLRLPEDAQQYLASLKSPVIVRSFAIRRSMAMAKLPLARQREAFEEMKTKYVRGDH